jgi:protein transport protein YIF1
VTINRVQKNRRTYFLAIYAFLIQMLFMWILSKEEGMGYKGVASKIKSGVVS